MIYCTLANKLENVLEDVSPFSHVIKGFKWRVINSDRVLEYTSRKEQQVQMERNRENIFDEELKFIEE